MKSNVNKVFNKLSAKKCLFVTRWSAIFNVFVLFFFLFHHNQLLKDDVRDNKTHKEIIANIRELSLKTNIADHEVIGLIWMTVMSWAEWNKKEELVTDQALKHLKQYTQLFQAFATTEKAELSLILKVQEFCYENMNFMKAFQKIIMLFYQGECHRGVTIVLLSF